MSRLIVVAGISASILIMLGMVYSIDRQHRNEVGQLQLTIGDLEKKLLLLSNQMQTMARPNDNLNGYWATRESEENNKALQSQVKEIDSIEVVTSKKPSKRSSFNDVFDESVDDYLHANQPPETAQDFYERLQLAMAGDGYVAERADAVSTAISNVASDYGVGIVYSEPVCSDYQCLIKSDISESKFSVQSYSEDEFSATDNYTIYVGKLNKSLSNHLGRPVQISIARFNNENVISILPKANGASSGGR